MKVDRKEEGRDEGRQEGGRKGGREAERTSEPISQAEGNGRSRSLIPYKTTCSIHREHAVPSCLSPKVTCHSSSL